MGERSIDTTDPQHHRPSHRPVRPGHPEVTLVKIRHVFGLLIAVALVVGACSGSYSAGTPAAPVAAAPGGSVAIANFSFSPATLSVRSGTTVTWTNNDSTTHTVTLDDGSAASPDLASGSTFQHTFTTAGTFTYHCRIHPTMTATIVVTQ
jgi:plastocyanin